MTNLSLTNLEWDGLTIAEALSCGLATVVPNNGPMNEFVVDRYNGFLIKMGNCYYREDGYYWPLCEIDIADLAKKIDFLATNKKEVLKMKLNARQFAVENLSLEKNLSSLPSMIQNVAYTALKQETREQIITFSKQDFGKFNKLYIKLYPIINIFYFLYGYIKPFIKKE